MYFKVSTSELLSKLNIVSKAISQNSPLPSLHGIKIDAEVDKILLTASDMDISIMATIYENETSKLHVFEEGSVVLEAKYFVDMIRKIDSDEVEIENTDGNLTEIRDESVHFELTDINADNYPLISFEKFADSFFITAEELKNVISQTSFAAAEKETRPVLTGINLKCSDKRLVAVATDSYRLAQKVVDMDDSFDFNITIPSKTMNEIAKILDSDQEIEVSVSPSKVLFVIGDVLIQTRLIDGTYPDTSKLIRKEFTQELVLDARDILNAINRASFIKNDGVSVIKMEISRNEVVISTRSSEVGSIEKIVPVSYEGDNLNISFKGQYVYDAVRALNCFQIRIRFSGEMKPFVLTNVDNEDVIQLVSPIRNFN